MNWEAGAGMQQVWKWSVLAFSGVAFGVSALVVLTLVGMPFVFEEVAKWAPSLRLVALYLTALLALLFLALMLAAGLVFVRESGRKPAEPRAESGRIEQRPARQTRNT